jgi:alpha-glucosidase
VQDLFEKNEPGRGLGRDPQRTPMQWSGAPNAGFTNGRPWLRLAADWTSRHVEAQARHPASMLALYRRVIELSRAEPALHTVAYEPLEGEADVLAYARRHEGRRLVVLLNFGTEPAIVAPSLLPTNAALLASTSPARVDRIDGALCLAPEEGVVLGSARN